LHKAGEKLERADSKRPAFFSQLSRLFHLDMMCEVWQICVCFSHCLKSDMHLIS